MLFSVRGYPSVVAVVVAIKKHPVEATHVLASAGKSLAQFLQGFVVVRQEYCDREFGQWYQCSVAVAFVLLVLWMIETIEITLSLIFLLRR